MNANLHHQQQQQSPPSQLVCEDCKLEDRLILHYIARTPKSPPQKLCTSCVLQFYRKSICAECFELYDANSLTPPPLTTATTAGNNRLLSCMRCENWSHGGCPRPHVPKSPYICPPCRSPNYKCFDFVKPNKNKKRCENGDVKNQSIDKDVAKQLLGAARISAITVAKAAATARIEAERKAKEAALARKRASEAIDHVVVVASKFDDAKRKELSSLTTMSRPRTVNYTPVRLSNAEVNNGVTMPPLQPCNNGGIGVNNGGAAVKLM